MSKEVVLLAVHGMGDTQEDFADDFQEKLADRLGGSEWDSVLFDTIYYQSVLQPHQDRVMKAMRTFQASLMPAAEPPLNS